MTALAPDPVPPPVPQPVERPVRRAPAARPRRFLLCAPRYFAVRYSINPWMRPAEPVDRAAALAQWEAMRATYRRLGHETVELAPAPDLPDLVFTANAGLVIDGRVLVSRFRHRERTGEEPRFLEWFRSQGYEATQARHYNEGEGDYLLTRQGILAGTGFRSDPEAAPEVAEHFGLPVIPLRLVDPRFYHLDTALAVLDEETVAYWPGAFSPDSQALLRRRFPDAVIATEEDAAAFGLNACSDGHHVVLAEGATGLAEALAGRGYEPILLPTSELQKSGGSVKCCTLELRP